MEADTNINITITYIIYNSTTIIGLMMERKEKIRRANARLLFSKARPGNYKATDNKDQELPNGQGSSDKTRTSAFLNPPT